MPTNGHEREREREKELKIKGLQIFKNNLKLIV